MIMHLHHAAPALHTIANGVSFRSLSSPDNGTILQPAHHADTISEGGNLRIHAQV
jgi:hypothetical protein